MHRASPVTHQIGTRRTIRVHPDAESPLHRGKRIVNVRRTSRDSTPRTKPRQTFTELARFLHSTRIF
ncbi:MAG: hypothetical protein KH616_11735 [Burkholderia sp.]|nr:hypothetical protein [Burkholderia sp.]